MKVVYHAAAGPDLTARLRSLPGLDIAICPEGDDRRLASLLPECEVLWHVLQRCTAEMIAAAPKLRLIQKIGVGVNTIDLDAAKARGIPVCNLPGTNARAVAELTLALMLSVLRRVPRFDASLRAGIWSDLALQDGLGELGGRVVGLVGYGSVPRILAPMVVAMGCEVLYTARHSVPEATAEYVPLETLLQRCDVISLHLPLTTETARLIDRAAIALMKKGCILINTARGGLVDEPALIEALRSGHLGGAGLDVFTDEPLPRDAALLALDNVVVTPHVAWTTTGTFDRSFALAAENCRRILGGAAFAPRGLLKMALQLRPNCEYCDKDLPPHATDARICTYECTFCADCVETKLFNVCPNCGGGFERRPIRPATAWRPGLSVAQRPASTQRAHLSYSVEEVAEFSARIRSIDPAER